LNGSGVSADSGGVVHQFKLAVDQGHAEEPDESGELLVADQGTFLRPVIDVLTAVTA
jgi:hypothetical protein